MVPPGENVASHIKNRFNFESRGTRQTRQCVMAKSTAGGSALRFVSDRHDIAYDNHLLQSTYHGLTSLGLSLF
jgi:hypothetical protein